MSQLNNNLAARSEVRQAGEVRRMAQPVVDLLAKLVRQAHWPILGLLVLYLLSGITAVKADEVAMVLRFGRLRGESYAEQVNQPGLLFAFPSPIDQVVRVKNQKIHEVTIDALYRDETKAISTVADPTLREGIDPEEEGYCLTGDRGLVQVLLLVRYQVLDPVSYALIQEDPHKLIRDLVQTSMVREVGRYSVDNLLSKASSDLMNEVRRQAQSRLDNLNAGLDIISVERSALDPPIAVMPEFLAVYDAFVEARRTVIEAQRYRETELPRAKSDSTAMMNEARSDSLRKLGQANAFVTLFDGLLPEYTSSPVVVRDRLYHETIQTVLSQAGRYMPIQAPMGEAYNGHRITFPRKR